MQGFKGTQLDDSWVAVFGQPPTLEVAALVQERRDALADE